MSKDDDRDPKDVWVWGLCKTGTGSWYKYPIPISPTPACSSNLEECYPFGRMYSLFHFFSVLRVGGTWNPYFQCQDTPPASEPISVSMSRLKGERNLLPCHTATAAGPAYQRRRIRVPEGQRKSIEMLTHGPAYWLRGDGRRSGRDGQERRFILCLLTFCHAASLAHDGTVQHTSTSGERATSVMRDKCTACSRTAHVHHPFASRDRAL